MNGTIGIVLVRKDKVHALGGLTFVADGNVEFFASFRGSGERDDELVSGRFEFGRGLVDGDVLDGQADRIEGDFARAVAENRERVGDLAKDFLVLDVEMQGDAGMLQIIVARTGIRFVRTKLRGRDKNHRQSGEQNSGSAQTICMVMGWHGHFLAPVNLMSRPLDRSDGGQMSFETDARGGHRV